MAGNLSIHPAPGLGDLLPGFFVVPQNPVDVGMSGISYVKGIGDILPGVFVVPQNPLKAYTSGQVQMIGQQPSKGGGQLNGKKVGMGGCGGGCGCDSCGGHSGGGMGQITTQLDQVWTDLSAGNYSTALVSDPVAGLPMAVWLVGGAFLLYLVAGPSQGSSRVSRARKAYRTYSNPRRRKHMRRR